MSVEMKDSGIAWIGEIPKHWNCMSLKFLCQISTGDKDTVNKIDDGLYPFFVRSPQVERINSYTYDGEAILMAGDGVGAGRVFHYFCGKFDFHQRVYNLHNIQGAKGKFLYYYLSSNFYKLMDAGSAKSTVDSVRLPMLKDFLVVVPTIEEQSRIANFLDKKCAEIDELIALQEQMIAQLNTYKQTVITETVTKGLNPNVKMKDSGVEWIGEIPEHWGNAKMKNFITLVESGVSVNAGGNSAGENEYGVLKTSSVSKYVFDISENKTVFTEEIERLKCPVKANTLIVSRMNTPELVGACGYVEENSYNIYLPDRLWQVHLTSQIHVKFVWYYLRSSFVRAYYSSLSSGTSSSMQNISQDQFANVSIMLPPLSEQQSIAQYLDQKCKEIDELISIKKEKIEHLKAYKKSVIYEYVTGKKHAKI